MEVSITVGAIATEDIDCADFDAALVKGDGASTGSGPEGGRIGVFPAEYKVAASRDGGGAVGEIGSVFVKPAAIVGIVI